MIDKDTLLEMIKEQEQAVQKAKEQLTKLYSLAGQMGISVDTGFSMDSPVSSIKSEIEAKRKELFERVEKMRQDALAQAQQMISTTRTTPQNFTTGIDSILSNPGFTQHNPEMFKNIMKARLATQPTEEEMKKMLEVLKEKKNE